MLRSSTSRLPIAGPLALLAAVLCVVGLVRRPDSSSVGWSSSVTLSNGVSMPSLAVGLWQVTTPQIDSVLDMAFRLGFIHVDSSIFYGVREQGFSIEPAVSRAVQR